MLLKIGSKLKDNYSLSKDLRNFYSKMYSNKTNE